MLIDVCLLLLNGSSSFIDQVSWRDVTELLEYCESVFFTITGELSTSLDPFDDVPIIEATFRDRMLWTYILFNCLIHIIQSHGGLALLSKGINTLILEGKPQSSFDSFYIDFDNLKNF